MSTPQNTLCLQLLLRALGVTQAIQQNQQNVLQLQNISFSAVPALRSADMNDSCMP